MFSRFRQIINAELHIPNKAKLEFIFRKIILPIMSLLIMLPHVIAAVIGVWRGYSIQVTWPDSLAFWGGFCIFLLIFLIKPKDLISKILIVLIAVILLITQQVKYSQSHHSWAIEKLYDKGQYQEVLKQSSKELNTWFLHLRHNWREHYIMTYMAQANCQLEQFEKAIETYSLSLDRYDYKLTGAGSYLRGIKEGLEELEDYREIIEKGGGNFDQYSEIGDIYRSKLNCYSKARFYYNIALVMEGPAWKKENIKRYLEDIKCEN